MVKFIHTADWQIGMKAAHVGAVGELVRAERLAAARRVVDLAEQHGVDFIAVTGDTFEDNAVSRVLVQSIADTLGRFAGPVYIIPGNHDPLVPGSVWEHSAWNAYPHVHVLRANEPVELARATLYPCPLHAKYSSKDPTSWIDATSSAAIAIGLAHGTVQGVAQDELDYPIARNAAQRTGLDYLAIGHWHSTAEFPDAAGVTRLAYSGTHEPTKFGEPRSGNVLLVEIGERGRPPNVQTLPTGGLRWTTKHCELHESGDLVRFREEIESIAETSKTLLDVRIVGVLDRSNRTELDRIEELVRARFLYGRIDVSGLVPRPDDDAWLDALPAGVLHDVARRLQELSDPAAIDRPDFATPEVATRALLELYRMNAEADG